jgi:predicted transcriptional regulator
MPDSLLGNPTFGDLRRNRFQDCDPNSQRVCQYLEQLSAQTNTVIDDWGMLAFFGIDPTDKRAINRVFFAQKDESTKNLEGVSVACEAAIVETRLRTKEAHDARITRLISNRTLNHKEAKKYQTALQNHITAAWNSQKEIYALQERGATYIADDLRKLVLESFWEFDCYENGALYLRTKHAVIMSESNPAAGIDRRVNLGRYKARLHVATMALSVERYLQNALHESYFHPYCSTSGIICWGNAGNTATQLLSEGKLYEVCNLLASLLCTYVLSSTPYIRLLEFSKKSMRFDAGENPPRENNNTSTCEYCEEDFDNCDCCEECECIRDNCHCCSICEYDANGCSCCDTCESTDDNCKRCRICDAHGDCSCCNECDRTESLIESRGHSVECSHYVSPSDLEAATNESNIPTGEETPTW